jgi:CRP/FNR family transcriptional regulator
MPADPEGVLSFRQAALAATLRRCRMFADLPSEDLRAVADGCATKALQKDEILFREGEKAEGFYVMQTGQVSIFRIGPDGRERIICVFRPPESFAEVAMATMETYPANAMALESSQVVLVRKAPFRDLVFRKPELALRMLASMSGHLKFLVQSLQDIKGRQIESRLADWFLRQSPAAAAGCPAVFVLPVAKKVLAGQLGVAVETLSRTFARFREEGVIRVGGSKIFILDCARLRAYADGSMPAPRPR